MYSRYCRVTRNKNILNKKSSISKSNNVNTLCKNIDILNKEKLITNCKNNLSKDSVVIGGVLGSIIGACWLYLFH
jgi:hypothetical protein